MIDNFDHWIEEECRAQTHARSAGDRRNHRPPGFVRRRRRAAAQGAVHHLLRRLQARRTIGFGAVRAQWPQGRVDPGWQGDAQGRAMAAGGCASARITHAADRHRLRGGSALRARLADSHERVQPRHQRLRGPELRHAPAHRQRNAHRCVGDAARGQGRLRRGGGRRPARWWLQGCGGGQPGLRVLCDAHAPAGAAGPPTHPQ